MRAEDLKPTPEVLQVMNLANQAFPAPALHHGTAEKTASALCSPKPVFWASPTIRRQATKAQNPLRSGNASSTAETAWLKRNTENYAIPGQPTTAVLMFRTRTVRRIAGHVPQTLMRAKTRDRELLPLILRAREDRNVATASKKPEKIAILLVRSARPTPPKNDRRSARRKPVSRTVAVRPRNRLFSNLRRCSNDAERYSFFSEFKLQSFLVTP